ncbi:uromodulin-like 1 [Pseudophryne corroboree]|uniref:uromodulin-like 1 n=1 Tax=Pseudophryne corroboree TaxID=495146 RepID=UPI00308137C7
MYSMISPASYHVCNQSVTVNVSVLVAFQKPREEKVLCMGWIPWKLCTRTFYQTEYRTMYVPETTIVKQCCEGYELVGHYCAMSMERSISYTSRPGKCPSANEKNLGFKCTLDYDCPGLQKCCMSSNGSFCASPGPLAPGGNTMYWYNGTISIKMAFDELIRLDAGFVNHTRLLHSMVTGELWPLEAAVYHISTRPAGAFSVLSHILIGLNESHSLPDITSMLSRIVTRLPEVIDIQIADVNSQMYPDPGGCPPGSYNCSSEHQPNSTKSPPTRPDIVPAPNPRHFPGSLRLFPATTTKGKAVAPSCYCATFRHLTVTNVTGSGFQIHWNTDCPDNYMYNIEIGSSKGYHWNNTVSGTCLNISGLNAGELYFVRVTFRDCDGLEQTWQERVKTDAKILNGTLKIQNWNLTESLLNPNSTDYTEFVKKFDSAVKQSLANDIPPERLTVEVQSLRPGSIIVNFQIIVNDSGNPVNLTASSLSDFNQSGDFTVDLKSITVTDFNECLSPSDNDCHLHADCKNLDGSYTCECHTSYVDGDPSRPGRTCEGLMSPSSPPWTSAGPGNDVYTTSPIDTSPPTISATTTLTAVATETPLILSATTTVATAATETSLILSATTTTTAAATETSTIFQGATTLANHVTTTALVSAGLSTSHSVSSTAVTLSAAPSTPENSTEHIPIHPTTHKTVLSANDSIDRSTAVQKPSVAISSTVHSVTEHGTIHSSTKDKGISPVVSVTTAHTATSNISCSFPGMSTVSNVEATSAPFLLPISTKMTTHQMSPSLTLKDASKVVCEMGKIGIAIDKDFLKVMSITSQSLFLGSPKCSVNCSTDIFILIQAGWKECNTDVYSNTTHTVVNSTLFIDLSSTFQHMTPKPISTIRCVFKNDILWSSGYNPAGGLYTIIEKLEGGGSFWPEFQLFIGDQPIPANFTLSATDDITVQIRIKTEESQYKVVINECWATPTDNSNDPVSFPFIKNSCALTNTFTTIHTNGISSNATFQTKIFSFVNNPIVYLHCRLHVCKEEPPTTCKPSCSSFRTVPSGENVFTGVTRMGPLRRAGQPNVLDSPSPAALGPGYIALIIIGVFALVAITAAILICWHKRRTGNYNFKLKCKDVGYEVFSN